MKHFYTLFLILLALAVSCGKEPVIEPDDAPDVEVPGEVVSGLSDIKNQYADKEVSYMGATVSIKFAASASWTASLVINDDPDGGWVAISQSTQSGDSKRESTVRVIFEANKSSETRSVELWISVEGFEPECAAVLTQAASGTSVDAKINLALNTYMHEILKEDYLFKDAYNAQEIDLTVPFNEFLSRHLLSLGDVNLDDGGYSRENPDERFIYTNIQEIQMGTKAVQTAGLGFGPFFSTVLEDGTIVLVASYVRRGSPAEAAGLRRGDVIYAVNGSRFTQATYYDAMISLYMNPSGSYKFSFLRFEDNGEGGYSLNAYDSGVAVASSYVYDPVLHASVLNDPDNSSTKIGYLVYESFDINSQEFLEDAVNGFIQAGITELILDLRFNAGGAVAQSRWLSGCIAGPANGDKTFVKVVYNNDKTENWTFDYGYSNDTDPLGKPTDLGLDRLFVITSYNTASAAELVINSLKGIDFPVKMIGCNTEGKNVGMVVSEKDYNGRRFQFSPVTFWVKNAKDCGDYGLGMRPDEYVNNDNGYFYDDADNMFPYSFSDWGNMDYNIALQWAYCDITGKPRWSHTPESKSVAASVEPMLVQPMKLENGRYGNLRYNNN
ncbi:MAG: PDZ domain-containing protein [Bacteroidales bacterium]|nr:PDZ domain-containing protein [Bacteroidales bacterium]